MRVHAHPFVAIADGQFLVRLAPALWRSEEREIRMDLLFYHVDRSMRPVPAGILPPLQAEAAWPELHCSVRESISAGRRDCFIPDMGCHDGPHIKS